MGKGVQPHWSSGKCKFKLNDIRLYIHENGLKLKRLTILSTDKKVEQ